MPVRPDGHDEPVHHDRSPGIAASLRIARALEKLLERRPVAVRESGIALGAREEMPEGKGPPGGQHEGQRGEGERHPPRAPRLTHPSALPRLIIAPAVASVTRAMNSKSSVSTRSLHR